MGWKYIMMESVTPGGTHILTPILFPDKIIHIEMYTVARMLLPEKKVLPYSAGEVGLVRVSRLGGRSETLNLDSLEGDKEVINQYPYLHGIIG